MRADGRLAGDTKLRILPTGLFATVGGNRPMKGHAMFADPYHLRLARPDERDRIREIEDLAGTRFAGLDLIDESLDVSFPLEDLVRLIDAGQVWVACDATDTAVGMVIASVREGAVYVEEMDVLAEHGRRGLGGTASRRRVRLGAGTGPSRGHPLDLPGRALERPLLPQARIRRPRARRVDARHAGDPGAGGPTRAAH